jgi:hypothetical protein
MYRKAHTIVFYTLLLLVYGIFFSVESFFNFEGHSNAKDIFRYSSFIHFSGNHRSVVKTTPLHSSSIHNIRLNKRFHQEDISPCPVFSVAVPESYSIPQVLGFCRAIPLPSITVTQHRLRGPPVVA